MNKKFTLSVVIPVYNEKDTIAELLKRVDGVKLEKEIIIVDDHSTDGTVDFLKTLKQKNYKVLFQEKNKGKGAALRRGFAEVTGDVVIIQDADLEYDPNDYYELLKPIQEEVADVVFGSRISSARPHRVLLFWHWLGNVTLTLLTNIMYNTTLTDMETCYKMMTREVLDSLKLTSNKFDIEPEITAKVLRGKWRIYEVPISYYGRSYEEGKKITWKDGFWALVALIRYRL